MTIKNTIYSILLILITFSCSPPASIEIEKSWAEQTLQELTLREKISQMLIYSMHLDFRNNENKQWQEIYQLIETDGIGGIHLWSGNTGLSFTMLNQLQRKSKVPILVDMDIERGLEQRFPEGTQIPPQMAIAATGNPQNAFDAGKIVAFEGRSVGVHWNLAPIVDVNNNPDNPIINTRSFSDDPNIVADYAVQYIKGLQSGGMLATAKHFPGHGDTKTDSHKSLATIPSDPARLWSVELAPYKKVIDAGVDAVMVSHLIAPDFQSNSKTPATLSKFWIQDVLRGKLGFKGAVVTDAMDMGGITNGFSFDYAFINAIIAGCDIIIQKHNYRRAIDVIENAVTKGIIAKERIDESALQMLKLKEKAGLHLSKKVNFKTMQRNVGTAESHRKAENIAQQSITLVKNDSNLIPVNYLNSKQINVIDIYGSSFNHTQSIATKTFLENLLNVSSYVIDETDSIEYLKSIDGKINENSIIIFNIFSKPSAWRGTVALNENQTSFINMLMEKTKNIIMVSYGNPYIIRDFLNISTYLCAWEKQVDLQEAGSRVIIGLNDVNGKLPINIPDVAKRGTGINLDKFPKYFQKLPVDIRLELQTVMPYEVGAEIDSLLIMLDEAVADSAFPGGVLLAAKDGKIFLHEAFGYHTYAKGKPTGRGNIYDLASLTKVISTTSAIMKLFDEQKIKLDDPVSKYIPEFIDEELEDLENRKLVTIKHLLTHTSGLPPFKLYYEIEGDNSTKMDSVYKTKLDSIPGEEMVYSDIGFMLLGKIIEVVSEKTLDQFVKDEIFLPIGMIDTYYNPSKKKLKRIVPTEYSEVEGGFVHGYVHDENAHSFRGVAGHAGLFSTADDLAIFSQMLLNGGSYENERVFSSETVDLFTKLDSTSGDSRYFGWDGPNDASSGGVYLSDNSYGHTGFTGTSLWIDPENKLFVILLTNAVHPNREWKDPKYYEWRQRLHSAVYESIGFTEINYHFL
jgi:beta-glucosidase-like glycosyl hydrolase/CubicO group peptidase (beta-lactamase class C family)